MQLGQKKTFFWSLVILAAIGLLLAFAFRPAKVDKWEAMTNRIDRLKIETRSRKLPRSALRGKVTPGNAWGEYNIALNDTRDWTDDQKGSLFARFVNGDPKVDRTKVEKLVASHAEAIEHLRLGTQRSDGQYPYNWERGSQMELPSLLGSRSLANVAVSQARILAEQGRPQEAVDLLLDTTIFGKDLADNATLLSSLIGLAVYSTAFDEIRHLLLSGKLSQKQLADLARKLEAVDRDFPAMSLAISNEALLFGISAVEESNAGLGGEGWWNAVKSGEWHFAIAPRATMVDAFETKETHLQRLAKSEQMDFAAARKEADAISAEVDASSNFIVRTSSPSLLRTITAHRETLAHLRLLRAVTIFLGTGEMPALADPFGKNLFYKQEGDKWKIWSIGSDGTNQSGRGKWEGRPEPDIVIEIPE